MHQHTPSSLAEGNLSKYPSSKMRITQYTYVNTVPTDIIPALTYVAVYCAVLLKKLVHNLVENK